MNPARQHNEPVERLDRPALVPVIRFVISASRYVGRRIATVNTIEHAPGEECRGCSAATAWVPMVRVTTSK